MQGEPFRTGVLVPVFPVPGDGMALFREVYADLVLAAGEKMNVHQAEPFGLFQDFIGRMGEFPLGSIKGRVNPLGFILGQIGGDRSLFGRQLSVDNGQVVFFCMLPILLQEFLGLFAFGKKQYPGRVFIQAMDHIHPVA